MTPVGRTRHGLRRSVSASEAPIFKLQVNPCPRPTRFSKRRPSSSTSGATQAIASRRSSPAAMRAPEASTTVHRPSRNSILASTLSGGTFNTQSRTRRPSSSTGRGRTPSSTHARQPIHRRPLPWASQRQCPQPERSWRTASFAPLSSFGNAVASVFRRDPHTLLCNPRRVPGEGAAQFHGPCPPAGTTRPAQGFRDELR